MELKFIKCGDYYVPDIKLKETNIRLGKWGRMRKEYLRLARPITTVWQTARTFRTKSNSNMVLLWVFC